MLNIKSQHVIKKSQQHSLGDFSGVFSSLQWEKDTGVTTRRKLHEVAMIKQSRNSRQKRKEHSEVRRRRKANHSEDRDGL